MPIPHFTKLQSTNINNEAVYPNLFEIRFVLPTIVQQNRPGMPILLLENATNINIDFTPDITEQTQRFKYSTRVYMTSPESTHREFDIDFNLLHDDNGSIFVWNTLKAWYDLVWNSQDGTQHYKRDLVGTVIADHHDKKGEVIRRATFQNVMIKGIDSFELNWENGTEILGPIKARFVSDYFIDEYIDNDFEITPPNIYGA